MSTRSRHSLTKRTRALAGGGLDELYGETLSVMMLLAQIADNDEERASDRRLSAIEWHSKWAELDAAVGKAAREASWESRRPRAV